ncbi:hypothetical protein [Actimicrobium sp. CCI2.3]|uniref:hypothetical protein n=1 Tax=Actimicrobium sp. CCI2.3 TaxID=3048616 RepID=UPI003A0FF8E6
MKSTLTTRTVTPLGRRTRRIALIGVSLLTLSAVDLFGNLTSAREVSASRPRKPPLRIRRCLACHH